MSEGLGSWLEYLEFDGQVYWRIDDPKGTWRRPDDRTLPDDQKEFFLPSDSSKRPDYPLLEL